MKFTSILLAVLLLGSSVFAKQEEDPKTNATPEQTKLFEAAVHKLEISEKAKDFRVTNVVVRPEAFCGGEGPYIYGDLQIRHLQQSDTAPSGFTERWETIRTYTCGVDELENGPEYGFMDANFCME